MEKSWEIARERDIYANLVAESVAWGNRPDPEYVRRYAELKARYIAALDAERQARKAEKDGAR